MPTPEIWPMPTWVDDLPPIERQKAKTRYLLCLATTFLEDRSTPKRLANRLGIHPNAINWMKTKGQIPAEVAVSIEQLLGRDRFPRELFRPDLFVLPE